MLGIVGQKAKGEAEALLEHKKDYLSAMRRKERERGKKGRGEEREEGEGERDRGAEARERH